jgi:hypothetical protein
VPSGRGPASTDPLLGRELRMARRRRRLGLAPCCHECGCPYLPALQRDEDGRVICYECVTGVAFEEDHVLGWQVDPTLTRIQPANYHRLLSHVDYAAEGRFYEYFYEHDLMRRLRGS